MSKRHWVAQRVDELPFVMHRLFSAMAIGYAAATELARQALATGRSVPELAVDSGMVSQDELDALLHPAALTRRVDAATGEGVAALGG